MQNYSHPMSFETLSELVLNAFRFASSPQNKSQQAFSVRKEVSAPCVVFHYRISDGAVPGSISIQQMTERDLGGHFLTGSGDTFPGNRAHHH